MERLWAPWRMTYIGGDEPKDEGCFLCRLAGEPDGLVVERAGQTFTTLNRFPYSSGHLMVVPAAHVPNILALDAATGAALFAAIQRSILALQRAMSPHGFNVGINHGYPAGGSVEDHLHVHVVPRWSGDTNFMPVLADVKVLPEALEQTGRRLREAYASLAGGAAPG